MPRRTYSWANMKLDYHIAEALVDGCDTLDGIYQHLLDTIDSRFVPTRRGLTNRIKYVKKEMER